MEVDNSSGHGKTKPDGLNVGNMNAGWGGKQSKLRDTIITEDCLGPHNPSVKVGDTQSMIFLAGCPPPHFDATAKENDTRVGTAKTRSLTKSELVLAITTAHPLMKVEHLKLKELKDRAGEFNPPIATDITEVPVVEGYIGKAKGLKQVLYERGLLDPNNVTKYYLDKIKSEEEEEPFCLRELLAKCADFEAEEP